jgi:protein-L-isoaspartate O-methyltransferase
MDLMDRETLHWLRTSAGQRLLAELAEVPLSDAEVLPTLTRLRAHYSPEQARAAVEQTLLRRRAAAKFPDAARLFFTREALEQASSAAVASHRARRFAGAGCAHVLDVGCGIGADTLALARAGCAVTALERDPLRLALAQANAEAVGLDGRIAFVHADAQTEPLPAADALFCDPGRRAGGRRRFSVEQYEPPLSHVLRWRERFAPLAVKLAPGVSIDELHAAAPYELEFVSLGGELKEAVLWCGPLATAARRATVLHAKKAATLTSDGPGVPPPLTPPDAILYEPDPAIIRAGLVAHLAGKLGAAQLDASIAYLTAPTVQATPFARAWHIIEWQPFNLKRLRARLRALEAGSVTVKKRGSPLDTDQLARQLRGRGTQKLLVVLTQVQAQPAVLICREEQAEA